MSLQRFRHISEYKSLDVGEIQPVSSIHLDFLEKYLLPELPVDLTRLTSIKEQTILTDTKRKQG